ncbi:tol-pal system protein YbgF [Rhizobium sp. CFBP 8762]|uniref:tol-pal system protein YbgF n=1 Tax=Rhizobium sp. CFBP 8762 TaxID=2775279 RepID=UPI001781C837|nr:tol-pal system protein YbgF [Rhizobium sp. CFBP 8762]MBD8556657.1 tol-pal system protein YbgF [Rhizobium sp. CFBP 8762]
MKHLVVAAAISVASLAGFCQSAQAFPVSGFSAPNAASEQFIRVQGNEAGRVGQLEEQVRSLNGRIEEMSFQLLQMQEQIRKFQEDNEFRFQDLESGKSGGQKKSSLETPTGGAPATGQAQSPATAPNPSVSSQTATNTAPPAAQTAVPPTTLGSIEFDQNGKPKGATRNPDTATTTSSLPGIDPDSAASPDPARQTAALDNPDDLYRMAYSHVLMGDYAQAETGFRDYIDAFPTGEKLADANFWMGEAQYSQGKFSDAAKTFLNAHQTYSKSPKAPEMLLKLGMSLSALDNNDTACATLKEVTKRYPNASQAVKTKVTSERSRLSC